MHKVFVVSDGTGQTAEQLVQSAACQFAAEVELERRPQVNSLEQIRAVLAEAAEQSALVVHTLVSDQLRRAMFNEARLRAVDALDLLGPVLDRLATHLKLSPQEKPGLFRQLRETRAREIQAVEFAFQHDDGQNVADLKRAELVLVGVSRTMKTPTSLYLAYRGWRVANVPLVPELPLPPELTAFPPQRVFCLLMAPGRLVRLRRARARRQGIPLEPYAAEPQVRAELDLARRLSQRHGWRTITVTGKSVEEVAREIINLLPPDAGQTGPAQSGPE